MAVVLTSGETAEESVELAKRARDFLTKYENHDIKKLLILNQKLLVFICCFIISKHLVFR